MIQIEKFVPHVPLETRGLYGFVRPHWASVARLLLLSLAATLLVLLQPWLTKMLIDDGLLARDYPFLLAMAAAMIFVGIVGTVLAGVNRLLHTRLCSLGNAAGKLEAIDDQGADLAALTEGVGPHPLFNGVRRAEIAGLSKPEVETLEGGVTLRAAGFSASFAHASVETNGTQLLIRLHPGR